MLIYGIYADLIFQRSCIPKTSLYFPVSCMCLFLCSLHPVCIEELYFLHAGLPDAEN